MDSRRKIAILLRLFQTSSAVVFNATFSAIKTQQSIAQATKITKFLVGFPGGLLTTDQILSLTTTTYCTIVKKNKCTGAITKDEPAFLAVQKTKTCWNCGSDSHFFLVAQRHVIKTRSKKHVLSILKNIKTSPNTRKLWREEVEEVEGAKAEGNLEE